MSYAIINPGSRSIEPMYATLSGLSGPDGLGKIRLFKRKKGKKKKNLFGTVAAAVLTGGVSLAASKQKVKIGKKPVKIGKIAGAVITGGVSLAIPKKKKKKAKKYAAKPVTVPTSVRPAESDPGLAAQTQALEAQARAAAQALPSASGFPWLALGIGVGSVALLGTIIVLATRR